MTDPGLLASGAPAVVLGGSPNGLGQVRALGGAGVKTFCVAPRDAQRYAAFSRHCTWVQCPDPVQHPDAAIRTVLDLGRRQPARPMLLFASDVWLRLGGLHEQDLRQAFVIPQSPWSLLERVLNKRALYPIADLCGTPVPATMAFDSLTRVAESITSLPFPCVIKFEIDSLAMLPQALGKSLVHRVTHCSHPGQLRELLEVALAAGFNGSALVQDYVPGGAETLWTLTSYTNRDGKLLAGAVGHKVRQMPPNAGGIIAGRIEHVETVFEQGRRLLQNIGFHGLANTEFKFDSRDGSYRLMEINPRLGTWNSSVLHAGVNLPMIAYADMQGSHYRGPAYTTRADGTLWLDTVADALLCIHGYRASGFPEHHLGFRRWLSSLSGPRVDAIWRWRDPVPGLVYYGGVASTLWRGLLRKVQVKWKR